MMKKCLAALLALCLILPCMCFGAVAEGDVYASDFSSGKDGWYARSVGNAAVVRLDDGLRIIGRAQNWNSPGRDFELTPGTTYWFSVDVYQTAKDNATFMISVAHKRGETETYENLGSGVAASGQWTTIYGKWTASAYDTTTLYVETSDAPLIDFTINNFRVMTSDPLTVTETTFEGELPSLKAVYAGKFDVGSCVSQWDVGNRARMALVLDQYSIVTPENELKPDAVLDLNASRKLAQTDETAVAVHFDSAKPLLDWAKANGVKVHGHVLVWHSQTPEAFFHEGYNTAKPFVTREVMLARLDNYIRQVMEFMDANYPGLIVSWDVVNEAVADGSSKLRESNWTRVVGEDFVLRAFEIADRYAPEDVLLCYNDYSTPYEPKLTGIVSLLESLVREGHIDAYGFQSHYSSGDPSIAKIRTAFEKVKALGLKLRVSELDITVNLKSDATMKVQAKRYAELFALYTEYADILEAVQVWGVQDSTSWISDKFPLLFDERLQPKPAFWAVAGESAE